MFFGGAAQAQTVSTPTLAPTGGVAYAQFNVTVTDATAGATLYYTTNGNTPTTSSSSMTSGGAVLITQSETLKVLGVKSGYTNSAVASASYTVTGQVVGGFSHSVALRSDGSVWAWGLNDYGEVGDGTSNNTRYNPVRVESSTSGPTYLSGVTEVATGNYFSMALKSDGTVWCWGGNGSGNLGNGTGTASSVPVQVVENISGYPNLTNVIAISAGAVHGLALKSDGTVWAWGSNSTGQLGDGTTTNRGKAVQVTGLSSVTIVAISAGYYHNLALDNTGKVYAWGFKNDGQLGDGTSSPTSYQTSAEHISSLDPASGVSVVALAAGGYHSLALKSDGTVMAWGLNNDGQIGDTTNANRTSPVQVHGLNSSSGMVEIEAGGYHSLAIKNDGTVWDWGNNDFGELGVGNLQNTVAPVQMTGMTGAEGLGAGDSHTFVLKNNGTITFCGRNEYGQAGDGSGDRTSPVQATGLGTTTALNFSGGYHALAVKNDGTLWSFGNNLAGELGDTTTNEHLGPEQVSSLTGITSASTGSYFSLAVDNTGKLWSWGYNNWGQLGYSGAAHSTPTQVSSLSGITSASAGPQFSLAVKSDGTLWAWGLNANGQLAFNTPGSTSTPTQINAFSPNTVVASAAGGTTSMALDSGGNLWTWGGNANGQLGNGSTSDSYNPAKITGFSGASILQGALGQYHGLALDNANDVWAWGGNGSGQVGDGTTTQRTTPQALSSLNPQTSGGVTTKVIALSGGNQHSVALKSDGTVWNWGLNADGQLGDGTTASRSTPEQVSGLNGVVAISAGNNSSLALKQDGTIEAWGNDSYGQLTVGPNYSLVSTLPGLNLLAATPTPGVSITYPANNASEPLGTALTFTASASETGGTIASVAYYLDSTLVGTSTSGSSYSFTWTPTTWGNFTFTAVATDSAGNTSLHSSPITVTVPYGTTASTPTFSPGGGTYTTPPTVTISSTAYHATIYYTTDGSTPTTSSPHSMVSGGQILVSQSETINAIAVATGYANSVVGTATYTIQPSGPPPQITSAATANIAVNVPFSYLITASNSPTSFNATGLPAGLSVGTTTGVISGSPTASGIFSVGISATNSSGTGSGNLVINVGSSSAVPVIDSPGTAVATTGSTFAYRITASNNPYQFGATSLPTGLSLDSSTGIISGTVLTSGTYSIGLLASNGSGTGGAALILTVTNAATVGPTPVLTSASFVTANLGTAFSYTITASNSPTSYSAINLPSWLSFNSSTASLTGTPTSAGNFYIPISATNINGTASTILTIQVGTTTPTITSSLAAQGAVGSFFYYLVTANNLPTTFSASNLPSWLSLNSSTGELTGTPTSSGNFSLTITASNGTSTASGTLNVSIDTAHPVISSNLTAAAVVNQPFVYTIDASNTPTSFTANFSSSSNLSGLSLDTSGNITGTVNVAGTYTIPIAATNSSGTGTANLTLTVGLSAAPVWNNPALIYATPTTTTFNLAPLVIGNPTNYTATGLPSGLTLNTSTGVITGTPPLIVTGTDAQGHNIYAGESLTFSVSATNALGTTSDQVVLAIQSSTMAQVVQPILLVNQTGTVSPYGSTTIETSSNPSSATTNFWNQELYADSYLVSDYSQTDRILLSFSLISLPPDSQVGPVSLQMTLIDANDDPNDDTLNLYQPTDSFTPQTATWAANDGYNSDNLLSAAAVPVDSVVTWNSDSTTPNNFSTAVQSALQQNVPLYLMLLDYTEEQNPSYYDCEFYSETGGADAPCLTVTYTTAYAPIIFPESDQKITVGFPFYLPIPSIGAGTSITASNLPPGLSLDSSGTFISGTPTTSGIYQVTIAGSNGNGTDTTSFNIGTVPTITAPSSASGAVGSSYSNSSSPISTSTGALLSIQVLPSGLIFDPVTGVISGMPTMSGSYPILITSTNEFGSTTFSETFTVNPIPPVIAGSQTFSGNVGVALTTASISAANQPTSFSSSNLPAWLTINSSGVLTGIPPAAGAYPITVTASNTAGTSPPVTVTLKVAGSIPVIVSESAMATVGGNFSFTPSYSWSGGTSTAVPITWSASALPAGLVINPASGAITGQPAIAGTSYITVTASGSFGSSSAYLYLTVPAAGPAIISSQYATGSVNVPFQYNLVIVDNITITSTQVTNLPAGLTYTPTNNYSGVISGTPTVGGNDFPNITITDATGITYQYISLAITNITSSLTATAQVGQSFSYTITAAGSPTSFNAINLPPGLSLNSATGVISGTPVTADVASIVISSINNLGTTQANLTLTINPSCTDASLSFQQGVSPTANYMTPAVMVQTDTQNPATQNTTYNSGSVLDVGNISTTALSRALLSFDLSALPANATITSARLVMNASSANSSGAPISVEIHQAVSSFNSNSANWATNNFYNPTALASSTLNPASIAGASTFTGTAAFTSVVQQAYTGAQPLNLVLLAPAAESSVQGGTATAADYIGFAARAGTPSQNPQLVLTYTLGSPTAVPVITSPATAGGNVGQSFTYTITATNRPTSYSTGTLPAGLSLNSSTGVISGTPTTAGSTPVTIHAINSIGTGSASVAFNIDSATPATTLSVTGGNNQLGQVGAFAPQALTVQAGNTAGVLPNALVTFTVPPGQGGLSGTLSGTPSSTLTVLTNGSGQASVYCMMPSSLETVTITAISGTAAPVAFTETSVLSVPSGGTDTGEGSNLPILSVLSGQNQSAASGTVVAQPIVVQALNRLGQPFGALPLTLNVIGGGGGIGASAGGTFGTTLSLSTQSNGQAVVYLKTGPGASGTLNTVSCSSASVLGETPTVDLVATTTAGSSGTVTPGGQTTFQADVDPPPLLAPTNLAATNPDKFTAPDGSQIPDTTRLTITWTAAASAVTYYLVEKSIDYGNTWSTLIQTTSTQAKDTGLLAGIHYLYRVTTYANGHSSSPAGPFRYEVFMVKYLEGVWYTSGPDGSASTLTIDQPASLEYEGFFDDLNSSVAGEVLSYGAQTYRLGFNPSVPNSTFSWFTASNYGSPPFSYIYSSHSVSANQPTSPTYQAAHIGSWYGQDFMLGAVMQAADSTGSLGLYGEKNGVIHMGDTVTIFPNCDVGSSSVEGHFLEGIQQVSWSSTNSSAFSVVDPSGKPQTSPITFSPEYITGQTPGGGLGDQTYTIQVNPQNLPNAGDTITFTTTATDGTGDSLGSDTAKFTYVPSPADYSMSLDESAGPKYRKIALNGLPLPDEKPQSAGESDQEQEQSYVDALTLGVRHSTTDAYIPVSGSDFSLSARRDFRSEVWSYRNGLRPYEKPDQPFGPCWSSNLAANIQFTHSSNPKTTQPDQAIVTDETGAVHTFLYAGGVYFPMPTAKNEAQTPNLENLTANLNTTPVTYTFTRKYGATLTFQDTGLNLTVAEDRVLGSQYGISHKYSRLIQAVDRVGNVLNYAYASTTNLVPTSISVVGQPDLKLSIQQGRMPGEASTDLREYITAIWDADGNETTYGYTADTSTGGAKPIYKLTSVTTPDGAVTHYGYELDQEADKMPHAASDPGNSYWHLDLGSITDPNGNSYGFSYANTSGTQLFDQTKFNYMNNPAIAVGYYPQCGQPRNVTKITMPDGTASTFANNSSTKIGFDPTTNQPIVIGSRQNQVTDATGFTRTYRFINPVVFPLPQLKVLYNSSSISDSKMICYQTTAIDYGTVGGSGYLGTEQFTFDPNAGMALKQTTDLSGNTTTFTHTDPWTASAAYLAVMGNFSSVGFNGYYGDPDTQTNAIGGTKTFTYSSGARIMTSVRDENLNTTTYTLDSLQRRTKEVITDPSSNPVQETDWTYDAKFPGFIDTKTIVTLSGDASGAVSLLTQYVPDADGRVAQEIVDPNGLYLLTSYTYDANGNKLTATDPRGDTTWFSYDARNRLVTVTNPDGSQKQMVYDARGNKIKEYDENGDATLYAYDSLSRLTRQARDMNGNGTIDAPTVDLVTAYTYNAVNSKLTTTDPNGHATTMAYDNLQRVTQITDALLQPTRFLYGANSGGNAFDSASFKPTQTTDPRGIVTTVTYDALYRPTIRSTQIDSSGAQSAVSTQYDAVGNVILSTDPLGHQTGTTYDALNRPVTTTLPDTSTIQTAYTSTGLKWKTTDELDRVTQTLYDGAGRPVQVIQPSVNNGVGGTATPITKTYYDAAGNVASTINPLGQEWDNVHDARNRKVQALAPAVLDAVSNTTLRPTVITEYDPAGNVIARTDARGNTTTMSYDPANRLLSTIEPSVSLPGGANGQPTTRQTYDQAGNVLTVIDPDSHTTTNVYDALNRLYTTTDDAGIVVTTTYDAVGNKLSVSDGKSQTTTFTYDGLNRNTSVTDAATRTTTLRYDALNKTQRIDALGQTTSYLYDVRNQLQYGVYASGATANSQRNYAYDSVGNLLSVTEPAKSAANVVYAYDALNRVTSETSQGQTHGYVYDLAGNRLSTVYGGTSRTLTSTYDALNRLSAMAEGGRTTGYAYDLNGNIVQKTAPNGDTEAYSYDALNRATVESAQTGGAVSLFNYQYGYDLAGNVLTVNETYPSGLASRLVTNTYDDINRLTQEAVTASVNVTTSYAYDNANNRTSQVVVTGGGGGGTVSTNYTYNNLNQLTGYGNGTRSVALSYDLDGNRSTRVVTGGSDNGTDTYSYDFENRLIGLVKGTSGGAGTYAYTYDYRTRRIVRDESSAGGVVTNLVFSGGTSVQEYTGAISTADLTVEYLRGSDYGGGVGGILYSLRGGTPSYTHENKRGDVVAKTDGTGTLTYQAQYQAFGQQTQTSGSTLDRQKSNSKDTDPTNLVDEGFRYRDLDTGMFLSRDPAGFVDGPNLYTYVVQNPWTSFDPEGLNTTFGYNGPGESLLPDPVADYQQTQASANQAISGEGAGGRTVGALGVFANGVFFATDLIPGVGAAEKALAKGAAKAIAKDVVEGQVKQEAKTTVENSAKKTGEDAAKEVHGNSLDSTKPQHTYDIVEKGQNGEADKLHKTGVSGQELNKDGSSPRANTQVNKMNKEAGYDKYGAKVTETNIPGRKAALEKEQQRVDQHAAQNPQGAGPPGNKKPQPSSQQGSG